MIKLQLVEAGLVESLLDIVDEAVGGVREEDVAELKTASDLLVLLLLGGAAPPTSPGHQPIRTHARTPLANQLSPSLKAGSH